MKKNKTIAYLIAATLLVTGTFIGTKALFTDKIDVAGELAISTGDLDIEVVGVNDWVLDRNGTEYAEGTTIAPKKGNSLDMNGDSNNGDKKETTEKKDFANNLKPGDVLTKTIEIENKGTLVAQVELGNNFNKQEPALDVLVGLVTPSQKVTVNNGGIDVTVPEGKFMLLPGKKATIELTLSVDGGGQHNDTEAGNNYNTDVIEDTVVDLTDAWTLDAVQQNPKDIK